MAAFQSAARLTSTISRGVSMSTTPEEQGTSVREPGVAAAMRSRTLASELRRRVRGGAGCTARALQKILENIMVSFRRRVGGKRSLCPLWHTFLARA